MYKRQVYSNKNAWPVILIVVSAFKNVGYGTVMYLASIVNIDGQLFEAADLDGRPFYLYSNHKWDFARWTKQNNFRLKKQIYRSKL